MQTQKVYGSMEEVVEHIIAVYSNEDVKRLSYVQSEQSANSCIYNHDVNGVGCAFGCLFTYDIASRLTEKTIASEQFKNWPELCEYFDFTFEHSLFDELQTIHDDLVTRHINYDDIEQNKKAVDTFIIDLRNWFDIFEDGFEKVTDYCDEEEDNDDEYNDDAIVLVHS